MKKEASIVLSIILSLITVTTFAENRIVIDAKKSGAEINKAMWGIFFEDINFAADGGLYAEMVKNRSFEFPQALMGWKTVGNLELKNDGPFDRAPHYLRMMPTAHPSKLTIAENEGYFGISTKLGEKYRFSVWARCPEGGESNLQIQITNKKSEYAQISESLTIKGKEWRKYTVCLTAGETADKQVLRLILDGATLDLEHVSLFPVDTWKGRENGLRKDLAQALDDLHPGVFRFPGGCIVEGAEVQTRYNWKHSVGPVENRQLNENRWNYCFGDRIFPDYYQSYGLGFYEYFLLCEDLGAEPLPVISCGLPCQYMNGELSCDLDGIDEFIQDALDLIEFANGSAESKWGKVRADMGHREPFNMKMLAIGNEQWDYEGNPAFTVRLKAFLDVLRKQHPEINYIGSTGPDAEDWKFKLLQPRMKELKVEYYDEHYYRDEIWFADSLNRHRYDNYDRKGPKVFAGEYACHPKGKKWNQWRSALMEASFMTGLERNADVVRMASYAPLFAHIEGWQWRPDLIWFDNQRLMKSCSYYVQQMYSNYRGDNILKTTMDGKPVAGDSDQNNLFASSVSCKDGTIYVKLVNTGNKAQEITLEPKGRKINNCIQILLSSEMLDAENTLDNPDLIRPVEKEIELKDGGIHTTIPGYSFSVFILK